MVTARLPALARALLGCAALAQPGAAATHAGDAAAPSRPNIVMILADDLGYGDLGSYGQQKIRTPALDRMASEGVRFTQFYAGAASCMPSRYALLTGHHIGHAFIRNNTRGRWGTLRPEDRTIAEILRAGGYATGMFGKWALGEVGTSGSPDAKGFDRWYGFTDQGRAHRYYTSWLWRSGEQVRLDAERDYTHDLIVEEAFDFVRVNAGGPFFLYLAVTIPHAELRVPDDSLREYQGRFPEIPFENPVEDGNPDGTGYRSQATPRAAYAAMVSRLDRDVGRLLDLLGELGIDDRTIVFFTSDNGPDHSGGCDPAFFDSTAGLRGIKDDLYEGGIRVPMIVRWPGRIRPGTVSDHVWAGWDFPPTAAELAQLDPPDAIDGISMLPVLLGAPQPTVHDPLYWETFNPIFSQALRMGDWKMIRVGYGGPVELYDLARDPGETRDLASRHPDALGTLESVMRASRTESPYWRPSRLVDLWRMHRRQAQIAGVVAIAVLGIGSLLLIRVRSRLRAGRT